MCKKKDNFEMNETYLNDSLDVNTSIYDQIKSSSFKRKYSKIIKFLVSKNINPEDIQYQKKIVTKDKNNLYPHFSCFFPNYIKDQNNIFLLSFFYNQKLTDSLCKNICETYFYNLDNLFMIIFFDNSIKPLLFFRSEDNNKTFLLKVEGKNIQKFFKK